MKYLLKAPFATGAAGAHAIENGICVVFSEKVMLDLIKAPHNFQLLQQIDETQGFDYENYGLPRPEKCSGTGENQASAEQKVVIILLINDEYESAAVKMNAGFEQWEKLRGSFKIPEETSGTSSAPAIPIGPIAYASPEQIKEAIETGIAETNLQTSATAETSSAEIPLQPADSAKKSKKK